EDFRTSGREASVAFAISKYMTGYEWLSRAVTVAILAGFSSVILVMLLGQSRVFYSMARDGLVPKIFSDVHPKFQTPWKSNMLFFFFTAAVTSGGRRDLKGTRVNFSHSLISSAVFCSHNKSVDITLRVNSSTH